MLCAPYYAMPLPFAHPFFATYFLSPPFPPFPIPKFLLCCPWFSNVYPPNCLILSLYSLSLVMLFFARSLPLPPLVLFYIPL
ncbi:hypothetical protein F4810DRAFT_671399 [Camillea tinctor]|nr:hypothetical protein F4810DRAFT_671399 [Camillea tinctor]